MRSPRQYVIASRNRDGTVSYYMGASGNSAKGRWAQSIWAAEAFGRNDAYALAAQIRNHWKLPAKVETRTEMAR